MALSLPPESYLWFKTFHIIGVVVWFAGLFISCGCSSITWKLLSRSSPSERHSSSNTA